MPTVPDSDAPQSKSEGTSTPASRLFTVADANRLLPFLRSTLADAQSHLSHMRDLYAEMRRLEAVGRRPDGELILAADYRASGSRLAEHQIACEQLLRRISELGCQVKDLTAGLCDFPAVIGGQPVLLCWRMEEPSVAHYHSHHDGYRGRQPLPPGTP